MTNLNPNQIKGLTRKAAREACQDAGMGGSWTASASAQDFRDSLLAGHRMMDGRRVDAKGLPLDGQTPPQQDAHEQTETRAAKAEAKAAKRAVDALQALIDAAEPAMDAEAVAALVDERVAKAIDAHGFARPIEVKLPGREPVRIEGRTHADFPEILATVATNGKALLNGPAGSGKTTLAKQLAEALGVPFYFQSCSDGMSEADLVGRMLFDGTFVSTPFCDAFETGGLCLLDEAGAMPEGVSLCLNGGIENRVLSVTNRKDQPIARMHEDFYLVVADNAFGGGGRIYTGRNVQDGAFLDRFAGCVFQLDADKRLERDIVQAHGGDDSAWIWDMMDALRSNVAKYDIRRVVSVRTARHLAALYRQDPKHYTRKRVFARMTALWTDAELAKAREGIEGV